MQSAHNYLGQTKYSLPNQIFTTKPNMHYQTRYSPYQICTTQPNIHYQTKYSLPNQILTTKPYMYYQPNIRYQTKYALPNQIFTTKPNMHYQTKYPLPWLNFGPHMQNYLGQTKNVHHQTKYPLPRGGTVVCWKIVEKGGILKVLTLTWTKPINSM